MNNDTTPMIEMELAITFYFTQRFVSQGFVFFSNFVSSLKRIVYTAKQFFLCHCRTQTQHGILPYVLVGRFLTAEL